MDLCLTRRARTAMLALLLCALPGLVSAQVGGSVTGTVKDQSGAVVPGATVTAMNTVLGTQTVTVTDAQGFYSIPKLPVGRYDITISLEGFKAIKRAAVAVDADA